MIRTVLLAETPQEITFNQFFEPPLESGTYLVTASQRVSGTGPQGAFDETFAAQLTFAVQGLRFNLPPNYLQTRFPQPAGQGEYSSVLPHVVLTANTLPWQRDPGVPDPGDNLYPWLALLVFDETDPAPTLTPGTLADLLQPPPGVTSYPLDLEYGEALSDPVTYIDVPVELFRAIVPQADELLWLTHARTLSDAPLLHKATSATNAPPAQEFSVVVGNRLPQPGHRTTCFLVSLENMGQYLPGATGGGLPDGTTTVRLASLTSWGFASLQLHETFAEYLNQVDRGTLQIPYANATGVPHPDVVKALQMGYTALGHHTRQGADIVSWYRGPLLPFEVAASVNVPVNSADALTNYDPERGLPDVSLGAAWQLGRLLALNDQAFATTLYNWRRSQEQSVVTAFEQAFLLSVLRPDDPDDQDATPPAALSIDRTDEPFYARLVREAVLPALAPVLHPSQDASAL